MKNKLIFVGKTYIIDYPTPLNINYNLSFGDLSGVSALVQIITGILYIKYYILCINNFFKVIICMIILFISLYIKLIIYYFFFNFMINFKNLQYYLLYIF